MPLGHRIEGSSGALRPERLACDPVSDVTRVIEAIQQGDSKAAEELKHDVVVRDL